MSSSVITNIKTLYGLHEGREPLRRPALAQLPSIDDAYLIIEDGLIASYGCMNDLKPHSMPSVRHDAKGGFVLPGWCDSHTHLVYPAPREQEFIGKLKGMSYAEIAASGGGILNSANVLAATSEESLYADALQRLNEAVKLGTTSIEIKSGYGLTLEGELKMLRVIRRLKQSSPVNIKATFLGAHAYPAKYTGDHQGYLDLVLNDMLPAIATEGLADYMDVFCEQGFFNTQDTLKIAEAGIRYGLKAKIHANQLSASGAVEAGVQAKALSVDHLEVMDAKAIDALKTAATIGTLLPTAAFFLRMPYQPARTLIDAGCAIALASDCNPGSSPSYNMNFVVSLACIAMKMLPEEAINAATFNGACAMELQHITGSICAGKRADLIVTNPVPSLAYLPYSFGRHEVAATVINGTFIE